LHRVLASCPCSLKSLKASGSCDLNFLSDEASRAEKMVADLERERNETLAVVQAAIVSGAPADGPRGASASVSRPTAELKAVIARFDGKVRGATVREHLDIAKRLLRLRKVQCPMNTPRHTMNTP
jgi:hypothetical protein